MCVSTFRFLLVTVAGCAGGLTALLQRDLSFVTSQAALAPPPPPVLAHPRSPQWLGVGGLTTLLQHDTSGQPLHDLLFFNLRNPAAPV